MFQWITSNMKILFSSPKITNKVLTWQFFSVESLHHFWSSCQRNISEVKFWKSDRKPGKHWPSKADIFIFAAVRRGKFWTLDLNITCHRSQAAQVFPVAGRQEVLGQVPFHCCVFGSSDCCCLLLSKPFPERGTLLSAHTFFLHSLSCLFFFTWSKSRKSGGLSI